MTIILVLALCCGLAAVEGQAGDQLVWRLGENRVDAHIDNWSLNQLLQKIGATTGWQIYVERETELEVSTKFKNLSTSEALRRLLGNLNFALLPQSNAAPKLFIYRTSLEEATQLVRVARDSSAEESRIGNHLIVTLKTDAALTGEELARLVGAKIRRRIPELNSYLLEFDDEAAAQKGRALLADNPDLGSLDSNYRVPRPARPEGLAATSSQPLSLKPRRSGEDKQIIIGLIDTPVQAQDARMKDFLLPSIAVAGETAPGDQLTHGTSMAETILRGLSAGSGEMEGGSVRILPVDIYGNRPQTTTFEVAKGIYTAINEGATVINLSLGSPGESSLLQSLIRKASQEGILFFAAAGNEPGTAPIYPAAYPEVVAVTAGDKNGNIAPYANRGEFIDVVAPGASIIYYQNQAYLGFGTSFATAYVTGVAAGLAGSTGKPLAQVEQELRRRLAPALPSLPP